ncbi:hypothetical protein FFRU_120110 [Fructobacillus fructosus]|uniref:hypothetical protein n=1 Tax=Fructobacillus fructosus TaxID=1631 RepID=UPI0002195787|nr:hypothetical protein [Fructobacillus fructosus]KRN51784.1 hypothetical protein IV71_GL000464 [Fructobacillus fructosus KCTC 3544]GAP01752.1 hypothetical protein FFRU_120110 [Fructobacillus fructosus]
MKYPNFFANGAGLLDGSKLTAPFSKRTITIRFMPSEEEMEMVLTQDNGKGIQSVNSQYKLESGQQYVAKFIKKEKNLYFDFSVPFNR